MRYLAVLLVVLVMLSCKNPLAAKKAKFEVTSQQKITTSFGSPGYRVTVKNTGNEVGYNVKVEIQAINGSTIVDTGLAFPGNLGNISPGQSAVDDAVFFNLTSHSDYTKTETEVTWLTRD